MEIKTLIESSSHQRNLPFYEKLSPKVKGQLQEECKFDTIYKYSLNDCYVTPYGVIFKNGILVKESLYRITVKNILKQYVSFYKKVLSPNSFTINDTCIVAHHSWFDNYYHFLIEILPRLFLLKDLSSDNTLLIHEKLKPFHKEILPFFNFKKIYYTKDNELVHVNKIIFPSYNRGDKKYSLHNYISEPGMNKILLRKTSDWIVAKTNNNNNKERNTKIYISRNKAQHRKVLNEIELITFLSLEEFKTIYMEDYEFSEQVNIINSADIIVGVCGAGLSNILFMRKDTYIINLIHKETEEFCFYNLANAMDVKYAHFTCEGNSKPNSAFNDIFVDIKELKIALNLIKQ